MEALTDNVNEMPTLPYLPSFEYWQRRMSSLLGGEECPKDREVGKPRSMARAKVAGAAGVGEITLSVAISGGSSRVKKGHPEEWLISGHGRWRQMHLGTIQAAYGATPYFRHLYPLLEDIVLTSDDGSSFAEMTKRIDDACCRFIDFDDTVAELKILQKSDPERYAMVAREGELPIPSDRAFVEVIFRLGKRAPLAVIPLI